MSWSYREREVLQQHAGRCGGCRRTTFGILVSRGGNREWLVAEWDHPRQMFVPHQCGTEKLPKAA